MAKLNPNFLNIKENYLFSEVNQKIQAYKNLFPNKKLYRFGVGSTTLPLTKSTLEGIQNRLESLSHLETYTGYGPSVGEEILRQSISRYYQNLGCEIDFEEIFVNDGSKSDCSNLLELFNPDSKIALMDPSYPIYVDSAVISGFGKEFNSEGRHYGITYLDCYETNGFLPEIPNSKVDVIYLNFPNNPTGTMISKVELQKWVDWAILNKAIILYDTPYSWFIQDSELPKSIYEIDGSLNCAIEIQSFSKFAGFTGLRLGWSVLPKALKLEDTQIGQLNEFWTRRQDTKFYGASNLAQAGGVAILSTQGQKESQELVNYYLENAKMIKEFFSQNLNLTCWGGEHSPFVWVKTPETMDSWQYFSFLLENYQIISTPGVGFGKNGENFVRLSSFANREDILEVLEKFKK